MNLKTGEFMSQFLENKTTVSPVKKKKPNYNQEIQTISDIEENQRISRFKNALCFFDKSPAEYVSTRLVKYT